MQELLDKLMEAYYEIKREIRQKDKLLYERWKAGGFLVDDDIISYYPNIGKVVEQLVELEDEECEEENDDS